MDSHFHCSNLKVSNTSHSFTIFSFSPHPRSICLFLLTFRCSWRLIYLAKKRKLLRRPMVNQVDRESLKKSVQNSNVLSRSGRSMRSLRNDQSSTTSNRVWSTGQNVSERDFSTRLNSRQLIGEIFYIIQPLVHLTSLGLFGHKTWTPWVLSSCCDILR